MFLNIFKQIITAKEFIIILIILLLVFPMIFALASISKKKNDIKKVPKKVVALEKKSLKNLTISNPMIRIVRMNEA